MDQRCENRGSIQRFGDCLRPHHQGVDVKDDIIVHTNIDQPLMMGPETVFETKRTIFWDMTRSSPVEVHQGFGGTYCLHSQGQISQTTSLLASLTLRP
jgi:hypothetical protein